MASTAYCLNLASVGKQLVKVALREASIEALGVGHARSQAALGLLKRFGKLQPGNVS